MAEMVEGRVRAAASALEASEKAFLSELEKSTQLLKWIAEECERENKPEKVKELEEGVLDVIGCMVDLKHHASALGVVRQEYKYEEERTSFADLLEDRARDFQSREQEDPKDSRWYTRFKEGVWNVHHAGIPMGDVNGDEDLIITNSQFSLVNQTCPLTGKAIVELQDVVWSFECHHVYSRDEVHAYIISKGRRPCPCPIPGCPRILTTDKLVCDSELLAQIHEMRHRLHAVASGRSAVPIADIGGDDDDDDDDDEDDDNGDGDDDDERNKEVEEGSTT